MQIWVDLLHSFEGNTAFQSSFVPATTSY